MPTALTSCRVLPLHSVPQKVPAPAASWRRDDAAPGRHAGSGGARGRDRSDALDAVHDAVSAALTGDVALCRLRQQQTLALCADRPHAAWAARREILRILGVDIIGRHLRGCDRRRRLQREIEELASRLHQMAAPEAA